MTEGILIVLTHMTQMYMWASCSASSEQLTCCCHQCVMLTLATKSEIELLDTVYIASARMHTTTAQTDSYFYLRCEAYLGRSSYPMFSAAIQRVKQALRHSILAILMAKGHFLSTKVARNGGQGFAICNRISDVSVQISDFLL